MNRPWLDQAGYEKAAKQYGNGIMDQVEGELTLSAIANEASWDAGFEAGVLAAEAGLGRADA